MKVTFSQFPPIIEINRESICFYAEVEGESVLCRISYEALMLRFRRQGLLGGIGAAEAESLFTTHRQDIEDEAQEMLYLIGKVVPEVLIV